MTMPHPGLVAGIFNLILLKLVFLIVFYLFKRPPQQRSSGVRGVRLRQCHTRVLCFHAQINSVVILMFFDHILTCKDNELI